MIGKGKYGKVMLVQSNKDKNYFALKIMSEK
jgi:hypothetical protein